MLDLLHAAFSILNVIATWRFVVALLAAAGIAFLVSRFMDAGPSLGWMVWVLIAIGVAVGVVWQYRHEKRSR